MEDITIYLSGDKLYGDDFSLEEIEDWYKDEQEGYAELGAKDKSSYKYSYHSLNLLHGFKYIGGRKFKSVLGLGSAYGDEFLPIIKQIEHLTIIDPSDAFTVDKVHGVPCKYVKPSINGEMPFEEGSFDLIVCLGVLHHIPNVTTVIDELYRCLAGNGVLLLREPIVSMGDWTRPRRGLTKRERGIPLKIFNNIISNAGFGVRHESLCIFPLIPKIYNYMGIPAYNNKFATWLDGKISNLLRWNVCYHPNNVFQKFRPASVYYVLNKN